MSTTTSMIYLNNSHHCCNKGDHHHQPSSTMALSQQLQRPSTIRCQRRNSLPRMSSMVKNNLYSKHPHQHHQGYCSSSNIGYHHQQTVGHQAHASAISLQYISQYLATPDTLILSEKLLANVAAQNNFCCSNTGINDKCHNNHHYYNLNQTSAQQQQHHRHYYHQNNSNHTPDTSDSIVDAATAQLEEIIRLCRTLQKNPNLGQLSSSSYTNNTGSVMNDLLPTSSSSTSTDDKYHCSSSICNKSTKCRCDDDCIRYFLHSNSNQNYLQQTNCEWNSIESSTIKTNHKIDKNNEPIIHDEQQHNLMLLPITGIDETGHSNDNHKDNNLTAKSINHWYELHTNMKKSPPLLINDLRLNHHHVDHDHAYDDHHDVKCQVLIDDHNIMEIQNYEHPKQRKKQQIHFENKTAEFKPILASPTKSKSSTPPTSSIPQYSNIDASSTTASIVATNKSNDDVLTLNGNGIINNNSNRLVVTKLVAKFEEKSSPHSVTSSLSQTSSLKQNNDDGNDHEDNNGKNNTIIHNNNKLCNLNRDDNINENDKRVPIQLPLQSTIILSDSSSSLSSPPSSTTKPKLKLKPKPPPKPVSLTLLSTTISPATVTTTTILSTAALLNENKSFGLSNSISSDNANKLSPKPSKAINDNQQKGESNINDVISFSVGDRENHATEISSSVLLIKDLESHGLHGDNQILTNVTINTTNNVSSSIDNINSYNDDDDEINDQHAQIADSSSIVNATTTTSIVQKKHQQQSNRFSLIQLPQITDLDQVDMEDQSSESNNDKLLDEKTNNNNNDDNDNKKCQSYCCCYCCCPNTSGSYCTDVIHNCNNKLLGIDLSKIKAKTIINTNPVSKPQSNIRQVNDELSDSNAIAKDENIHNESKSPPSPKLITKHNKIKCPDNGITVDSNPNSVLVVVADETSPTGSSDNSSSDEGIENPAVLDDDEDIDDDDDDHHLRLNKSKKLSHSHHQHHFNHHNQLVNHHQQQQHQDSRKSPSLSFKSSRTISPLFPNSTNPDDVHQVERFLNGNNSKHLNALEQEESLLLKEIFELESEQSELELQQTSSTTNSSQNKQTNDEEVDEELLEFQRIEREIKLSELRKCLQIVQKQIQNFKNKLEQPTVDKITDNFDAVTMATTTTTSNSSYLNEQCQLNQAQQEVQNNITSLIKSKSPSLAPLAESENDESDSKADSIEQNHEIDLSDDSDDGSDNDEEAIEMATTATKNENVNKDDLVRSLDDLLHESIETRLEKVNDLSEKEQESFVVNEVKSPIEANTSIIRRTSQYDNELSHDCRMKHFGYQRNFDMLMLKSVYQKLDLDKQSSLNTIDDKQNIMNASSISNEMLESTTTATDSESDSIVLRQRSARFPAGRTIESTSNLQSQEELSTHSDQPPVLRKRNSAISANSSTTVGGSQRPLTLYMPAPNQKINLITHLHALGHDLTSSIVTNHLLLTPYTCSGYLYKHCTSGVGKWRKRYFHFDRMRKVFVYYHDRSHFEKMRHPKRGVFFDEIQDVYVDHTRINMKKFLSNSGTDQLSSSNHHGKHGSPGALTNPAKPDGTRCVFVVSTATFSRKFILSTYTPELMRIWMDVIFTGAQAYLQDFDDQMN
nr:beclin-1-like protein A [Dermatophagoides farinae]